MHMIKALAAAAAFSASAVLTAASVVPAEARQQNLGPYQAGAAAAQYNYERFGETGYAQGGDVRNTCVKWCRRDSNPCDPPSFKQADGRCNPLD